VNTAAVTVVLQAFFAGLTLVSGSFKREAIQTEVEMKLLPCAAFHTLT
jgi:uncharacterized membrane protein